MSLYGMKVLGKQICGCSKSYRRVLAIKSKASDQASVNIIIKTLVILATDARIPIGSTILIECKKK